ncbi:MAG: glucuronate isomerase [Planctomycetes bacterium]|nr:glucuronate isomerase [Planctomycetota bacterium]
MAKEFLSDDFLLQSDAASTLYHEYAKVMPIYDYHCHLPVADIANNTQFDNISQVWLYGDHYKWRAMRTNGVDERLCTGQGSDWDKFEAWAATVPYCMRNPLYHWTHLELKRYFGITDLLSPKTAKAIYDGCNDKLNTPEYSVHGLMRSMNVKLTCTTEDPLDSLDHHAALAQSDFDIAVHTAWRPDKGMAAEDVASLNAWMDRLAELTDTDIADFASYLDALRVRHTYFHDHGCRLSDHGLETAHAADYTQTQVDTLFAQIRSGQPLNPGDQEMFKSAMMVEFALMDADRGWVQQLHMGALRNNNTRLFKQVGPDSGFDSIGDFDVARKLSRFLDRLDQTNQLPKTILYNLNPGDNHLLATMIGNFQDGSVAGKMQLGSGWWFLDQKDGMESQMRILSSLGLLSRFVGMLTDSRSFLSYPRHEYFRRILCNLIGQDVEHGELPHDMPWLGQMVQDICFNNAKAYFPMHISD